MIFLKTFVFILLSGFFWGYYRIFLHQSAQLQLNRFLLLFGIPLAGMLAFLLPELHLAVPETLTVSELPETLVQSTGLANGSPEISWLSMLWIAGAGIFLIRSLFRFAKTMHLLRTAQPLQIEGEEILIQPKLDSPASFLGKILLPDEEYQHAGGIREILAHEKCHIRQGHCLDLLALEIFQVLFWFNPFVGLFSRSLRETHEFLADRAVMENCDLSFYKKLLAAQVLRVSPSTLLQSFHTSPIKNRLNMLNKKNQRGGWKYLPLLPLLLCFALIFNPMSAISARTSPTNEMAQTGPDETPHPSNLPAFLNDLVELRKEKGLKTEGRLIIRLKVNKRGKVVESEIEEPFEPETDALVQKAVKNLTFTPAVKDGKKVMAWVTLPIKFSNQ